MPRLKIILLLLALVWLGFAHARPDGYIPGNGEQTMSMHSGEHVPLHKAAIVSRVHGKPRNHRIKAINADLADVPLAYSVALQVTHTEKVKTYIFTTRFFSHQCGFFDLRGPPALC